MTFIKLILDSLSLLDVVFINMPKSKKKAPEMTDAELLRDLIPKEALARLKEVAHSARRKGKK
jgi:hypothetical protein